MKSSSSSSSGKGEGDAAAAQSANNFALLVGSLGSGWPRREGPQLGPGWWRRKAQQLSRPAGKLAAGRLWRTVVPGLLACFPAVWWRGLQVPPPEARPARLCCSVLRSGPTMEPSSAARPPRPCRLRAKQKAPGVPSEGRPAWLASVPAKGAVQSSQGFCWGLPGRRGGAWTAALDGSGRWENLCPTWMWWRQRPGAQSDPAGGTVCNGWGGSRQPSRCALRELSPGHSLLLPSSDLGAAPSTFAFRRGTEES